MATPEASIAAIRDSACAIMRVTKKTTPHKGKPPKVEVNVGFVGTAWCIEPDRHVVTAHHTLNRGQARDHDDRFYVFTVPGNGQTAHPFPVTGFPLEDSTNDLAILEIGPSHDAGQHIPAVPVTMDRPPDGTRVYTYGFPSPQVASANIDEQLNFGGGRFFLKGHANAGIVAAQYDFNGQWYYEFNVGWHHGESGGPVVREEPLAAVAVMQHYRNIQSPHGVVAGPHRGIELATIQQQLAAGNATFV